MGKKKTAEKLRKSVAKTHRLLDQVESKVDAAIASKSMDHSDSILEDLEDVRMIAQNIIDTIETNHAGMRTREQIAADVDKQTKALRKKQACKHVNWIQVPDDILVIRKCSNCGEKVYH